MTNYFLAVNLPRSKHDQWVQDLIKSTSPTTNPGHKGIDISEIKIYHVRVYQHDEKILLEKLKTYNNSDHETGRGYREWDKKKNTLLRLARNLLGIGNIPLVPCNPINTPGHVLILARTNDKTKANGKESR